MSKTLKKILKKKKWIKIWSFLFLCFLFGVNTYAWFTYVSKVSNKIDGQVVEWQVIFADEDDNDIQNVSFNVAKMYPGMLDATTTYTAKNNSDLDAILDYKIKKLTLFGNEYNLNDDYTNEEIISLLEDEFPFKVTFTKSSDEISSKSQIDFTINVSWDYEVTNKYYKLNKYYSYLSDMDYYIKNGDNYEKTTVTVENYASLIESGLYLSSDYADTYWGEMSKIYNETSDDNKSLIIDLELTVKQA